MKDVYLKVGVALLGIALAVGAIAQPGQDPIPVAVATATVETWSTARGAIGTLRAAQEVTIAPELSGRVVAIEFESGQNVAEGDTLVRLDVVADRAQLADLQAQRRLARLELERISKLVTDRSLSESDKDIAESTLAQLEARILGQQDLINRKTLKAPFAGRLGLRRVNLGQVLSAGDEVVTLQSYQPLFVDFPVPQSGIAALKEGLDLTLRTDAYPDRAFPATVAAIDARVNDSTRAIIVRGSTENQDEALRPGMFVTVELVYGDQQQYVTVPSSALIYSTFGAGVFVVETAEGATTVRRVAVETGPRRGDQVAIASGLSGGELVVAAGQVRLRDGVPVRIDEEAQIFNRNAVRGARD